MGRVQDWLNESPANKNKMLERMRKYKALHPDEARDAPPDDFIMTVLMNGYIDEDSVELARDINNVLSGAKKKKEPEPEPQEEEPEIVLEEYKKPYEVWTWVPERDDPDLNGKNKKGV